MPALGLQPDGPPHVLPPPLSRSSNLGLQLGHADGRGRGGGDGRGAGVFGGSSRVRDIVGGERVNVVAGEKVH